MVEEATKFIRIDLNQFKLHLHLKPEVELTLHFDSPSRRFYLSLIGLVVHEMKKLGRISSISLQKHLDVLALLNKTVGMAAGSSKREHLLPRIYRKWKDALPDLENAPLFKVIGRKKRYDELMEKVYGFSEAEKDSWANLFEYKGSNENVRLRFSIDRLNASLDDVIIVYGEYPASANVPAWETFVMDLKEKLLEKSNPEHANDKFGAGIVLMPAGLRLSLDGRLPAIAWIQAASSGSPGPAKRHLLFALCASAVNMNIQSAPLSRGIIKLPVLGVVFDFALTAAEHRRQPGPLRRFGSLSAVLREKDRHKKPQKQFPTSAGCWQCWPVIGRFRRHIKKRRPARICRSDRQTRARSVVESAMVGL